MHMIAQNSYWAAKHLGDAGVEAMKVRGRMQVSMVADIVVFDPETVIDHATYDEPHQLSTGVAHVLVNGVAVVSGGEHTGAMPGRAVRGPGWTGWEDQR